MKKYTFIKAWGRMLGSSDHYINNEREQAEMDGAPTNAIYRDSDGNWHTTDNIESIETLKRLIKHL